MVGPGSIASCLEAWRIGSSNAHRAPSYRFLIEAPKKTAGMHSLTIQPRQIVLPIDFSDCSMDAYEYAVEVAKWFDAPLTLVCAIEPLSYSLDFTLTHPLQDKGQPEKN